MRETAPSFRESGRHLGLERASHPRGDLDSEQTLYRWREEFIGAGKLAMNGRGAHSEQAKAVERLSAEVAERD